MNINSVNNYNNFNNYNYYATSFKGKESRFGKWIGEKMAKYYAKPMYNQQWLQNLSKGIANLKLPGKTTEHMVTLGSAITSGTYMHQTLQKKELDQNKRRTLAANQGLCFIIPTILSYAVNSALNSWEKCMEYRYSGIQEHKKANGLIPKGMSIKEFDKLTSERLKGMKPLCGLFTFTMIYRYASPVIITPLANRLGAKWNKKKEEEAMQAKEVSVANNSNDNTAKEISINSNLTEMKKTA